MADYKRVVSYIYEYDNHIKRNNVGFARVETRGDQCKVTIHIRIPQSGSQSYKAYLYCWKENQIRAILLGEMPCNNGIADLKLTIDANNLMSSGYVIDEMSGIIIYVSEYKFFGTEWDDRPISFKEFHIEKVKPQSSRIEDIEGEHSKPIVVLPEITQSKEREQEILHAASTFQEEQVVVEKNEDQLEEFKKDALYEQSIIQESSEDITTCDEKQEQELITTYESEQQEEQPEEQQEEQQEEQITTYESKQQEQKEPSFQFLDEQARNFFSQMLDGILANHSIDGVVTENKENGETESNEIESNEVELNQIELEETELQNMQAEKTQQTQETSLEMHIEETKPVQQEELQQEKVHNEKKVTSSQELDLVEKEVATTEMEKQITVENLNTLYSCCTSDEEYEEIQLRIVTLSDQLEHLKEISQDWKSKSEILKQQELEKSRVEAQVRESMHLEEKLYDEKDVEASVEKQDLDQYRNLFKPNTVVSRIFAKYPKITPFTDKSVEDCIRIDPQDIGIFPMDNWVLANNSFLLHGYYSYRHLVFVKRKTDTGYEYLLGVPGINHSRERFMANMFGFKQFRGVTNQEPAQGDFGYWCLNISI